MEIIYPLFAMFALTIFVAYRMAYLRIAAAKSGQINPRFFKTYQGYEEPEYLRVISRHVINLYEMPVLFYLVGILILQTGQTSVLTLSLAWAYVGLRYIHSYIHLGSNKLMHRLRVFALSSFVLIALWLTLIIRLMTSG
ncbi:MAG: MAPEG family protein [Gammaproteobacteria bacterium]|nr:MAPEG family protein [Gammaproteobacteria bacterium]MCZ6715713.1 MAPEG family protein [Gammaproteobacteria bacterium]MCZ6911420.1 MAPEG family protein [Pseudomonadota bacterium]